MSRVGSRRRIAVKAVPLKAASAASFSIAPGLLHARLSFEQDLARYRSRRLGCLDFPTEFLSEFVLLAKVFLDLLGVVQVIRDQGVHVGQSQPVIRFNDLFWLLSGLVCPDDQIQADAGACDPEYAVRKPVKWDGASFECR